jgi:hypothetical protein
MTDADTYRRYAAECVIMSRQRDNVRDKAMLLQMATAWLKLAEFAEKNDKRDEPPPAS